jgi:hypothetical protein
VGHHEVNHLLLSVKASWSRTHGRSPLSCCQSTMTRGGRRPRRRVRHTQTTRSPYPCPEPCSSQWQHHPYHFGGRSTENSGSARASIHHLMCAYVGCCVYVGRVLSGLPRVFMADTPEKKARGKPELWPAVLAGEAEVEQYCKTKRGAQVACMCLCVCGPRCLLRSSTLPILCDPDVST